MFPLTWKLTALILPSLHTCIITSGQLQHHQGMDWGWNTETLLTKSDGSKRRQVILRRQTILHSGLMFSGTDWESASTGVRRRHLEKFDLRQHIKRVEVTVSGLTPALGSPLLMAKNDVVFSTIASITSYTQPCQVSQLLWLLKFTAIHPPSLPWLSLSPNCKSPSEGTGCTPHQASTSKSPQSSSLHRHQTKCNIISHLSLPRLLPSLPDLWFLFQELCKGAPLINPPSTN